MKIHFCKTFGLLIILMAAEISCLQGPSFNNNQDGPFPLIIQYIPSFRITTNDLSNAIKNQLKTITTGNVTTSYVTIDQTTCSLTYKNGSISVYQTPLRVSVKNDTYAVNCSFKVTVIHIASTKTYSCHAMTSDIIVNYTKQVDYVSGSTLITNFNSSYSSDSFKSGAACTEKQSDKDKIRINEALSNTQSHSVYLQLKKTLDKMKNVFESNVQTQHLSTVYPENPYAYKYYEQYSAKIDVSTLGAQKFKENGVVNKIKGTISSSSKFPKSSPAYEQGYSLFIAKEFIQNIIEDGLVNEQGWKNIKANRTNMRINSFKFRLVDYEYIIPQLLSKFPQKYLADTEISCNVVSYKNLQVIPGKGLQVQVRWSCIGSFEPVTGSRYTFLNFQPTLLYEVSVKAQQSLTVRANPTTVKNLSFNIVDGYIIEQITFVQYIIQHLFFEFNSITIGTYMRVGENSSQVKFVEEGIWIG